MLFNPQLTPRFYRGLFILNPIQGSDFHLPNFFSMPYLKPDVRGNHNCRPYSNGIPQK